MYRCQIVCIICTRHQICYFLGVQFGRRALQDAIQSPCVLEELFRSSDYPLKLLYLGLLNAYFVSHHPIKSIYQPVPPT